MKKSIVSHSRLVAQPGSSGEWLLCTRTAMLSSCLASGPPTWQGCRRDDHRLAPPDRRRGLQHPRPAARRGRAAAARRGLRRRHLAAGRGARPASSRSSFTTTSARWTTSSSRCSGAGPTRASRSSRGRSRPAVAAHDLEFARTPAPARRFNLEFVALANHRKAIRAEIASYAERFRTLQLEAISSILAARGPLPDGMTPEVVLVVMAGVAQLIALERPLGVSGGHDAALAFIEQYLDNP